MRLIQALRTACLKAITRCSDGPDHAEKFVQAKDVRAREVSEASAAQVMLSAPRLLRIALQGWQEVLVAGTVVRHWTMKMAERGRPEFHAIQVAVETLNGLDEIPDDHVFGLFFGLFWHCGRASTYDGQFLFLQVKRLLALLVPLPPTCDVACLMRHLELFAAQIVSVSHV
jgi:hypothetical protein